VSTLSAVLIIVAVLAFSGTAAYYQIRRAHNLCEDERARALETGRISGNFAPAVHDVGPDSLRLIEDLDAHMKAYGEQVADLYDTKGSRP
jgi:hypothetical protein